MICRNKRRIQVQYLLVSISRIIRDWQLVPPFADEGNSIVVVFVHHVEIILQIVPVNTVRYSPSMRVNDEREMLLLTSSMYRIH